MMQKLYRLWLILIMVSGVVALSFSVVALAAVWQFLSFNQQVPAQILDSEVVELPSSRFALNMHYAYEVDGKAYEGHTVFSSFLFLNRFAAEEYQMTATHKSYDAWYMQRNPALSSLENPFPYKSCIQALVTIGVFLYFYFARGLLLKFMTQLPSESR